jgi:hypothetical protein
MLEQHQESPSSIIIQDSFLSCEFKAMAALNGFFTIRDVLDYGVGHLPELPKGNYRLLVELLGFLEEHGLLELADRLEEVDR